MKCRLIDKNEKVHELDIEGCENNAVLVAVSVSSYGAEVFAFFKRRYLKLDEVDQIITVFEEVNVGVIDPSLLK